ncbi:hypothetical protein ABMQ79_004873 [Salmonella enterica]|nr:hypothetical protein [Salmonella enterica subsp. enterica serovar Give]EIF0656297.1 hypothetical protein [Salmonella enterica]EIL0142989.1 hypothetical protein [Salmonella enterica]EIL0152300.1 hypothetical protein [Salmonella enterica]EIQ2841101.1 hypothetical protein [Salmonella enterica]
MRLLTARGRLLEREKFDDKGATMRISNVEWLKKRIGFIRKLGEQTTRQRQIIDLLDDEDSLSEADRRLLHVLATAEKNDLQGVSLEIGNSCTLSALFNQLRYVTD